MGVMISPYPMLLFIGALTLTAAVAALSAWRKRRRKSREEALPYLSLAVAMLVLAATSLGFGIIAWKDFGDRMRSESFSYFLEIRPNGSGLARIAMPAAIPADSFFEDAIRTEPHTSTSFVDRTGAEPALVIEFEGPTWVNASFRNTDKGWRPFEWHNLTQMDAGISLVRLDVLEGVLESVDVVLEVAWSNCCLAEWYRLESEIGPGLAAYEGEWDAVAA